MRGRYGSIDFRAIAAVMAELINGQHIPIFDTSFYTQVALRLGWPTSRHGKSITQLRVYWNENRGNLQQLVKELARKDYLLDLVLSDVKDLHGLTMNALKNLSAPKCRQAVVFTPGLPLSAISAEGVECCRGRRVAHANMLALG